MVNCQDQGLDRLFAALADPTRRALLARLNEAGPLTVGELAKPFAVSLPAIMKHLDVLSNAELIVREKHGRSVSCELTAAAMKSAMDWLHRYERFWSDRLARLDAILEEDSPCPPQQRPSRASPSSAASRRRRTRSTPRGPKPKR